MSASARDSCPYLLPLLLLLLLTNPVAGKEDDNFVVAAYLPEYRSYINLNNTAPYLTDLIIFSLAPDDQGNLGPCCLEDHHFEKARQARAYKQEQFPEEKPLKLWMSIGGAGRSNFFPRVASNTKLRKKFIQSIRDKCEKEQLDGVDFDWEAPQRQEQYKAYISLLQEAHQQLTPVGLLISVALHPRQVFPKVFFNYVTRINLMTYDMIDGRGGHHASLSSTENAIQMLTQAGCPKSQIVVGIPAYARHGRNPGQVKTYSEIVDDLEKKGDLVDDMAKRSSFQGFLFDSPDSVRQKVNYAVSYGHAGVFFWELGQDKQHDKWAPGGMLLEAAANQVRSGSTSRSSSSSEL